MYLGTATNCLRFNWKEKSDCSLDLSAGQGVLSARTDELGGLENDLKEDLLEDSECAYKRRPRYSFFCSGQNLYPLKVL